MSLITKPLDTYGNRTWKVTTFPSVEPITVDEVKTFARIDTTEEDSLLSSSITAVREATEVYLGRALIEQTITLVMDFWPNMLIELPKPPLLSITGVYTTNESDVDTVYSSSNYFSITSSESRGKLVLKQGVTAPTNTDRDYGGFKIIYKAGYGDESTDVPTLIREGMKLWTAIFYDTKSLMVNGGPPPDVKDFLNLYRVQKI